MRLAPVLLLAASALTLGGCGLLPDAPEHEYEGKSAAQLYAMGLSFRRGGDFTRAIETFEYLEAGYPFDPYAQQGMLEMAYSMYRQEEYVKGIAVLDRFSEQNPLHTHSAYAHYLRGICYLDYGRTLLHYVLPYIRHNKDPTPWLLAFSNFSQVVTQHPDSRYAVDARQHTVFLRNLLANYEMHVADFYLRRKAYVAVVNRSKHALARYHGAPNMDDMLWYLEQGYRRLEIHQLADDARRVRDLNFPDYEARRAAAEAEDPTWASKLGDWVSETVDSAAVLIGFDIEDAPAPDFTGKYRLVTLGVADEADYAAAHEPDKIVVSEVPGGYIPTTDIDSQGLWYQVRRLLAFGDDETPAAPGDEAPPAAGQEAPEAAAEESAAEPAPSN